MLIDLSLPIQLSFDELRAVLSENIDKNYLSVALLQLTGDLAVEVWDILERVSDLIGVRVVPP